jgi:hypothetical protein
MKKLTIFSAPKPFTGAHIATIQRNAIGSWLQMGEGVEVLLVGDEPGLAEAASDLGVRHLPAVKRNEQGTPLVSSIFNLAGQASSADLMMFTNTDMVYLSETPAIIAKTHEQVADFVLLGQRHDLDVREQMDFAAGWEERLRGEVRKRGKLHPHGGSDYFIFPKRLFVEIPDFAIGRAGWDNWMIYQAISRGWLAIDATKSLLAIHQSHDYAHLDSERGHQRHTETTENIAKAGGMRKMHMLLDVEYELVDGHIRPAGPSFIRWLRKIERSLQPDEAVARGWRRPALRLLRKLRRAVTSSKAI